MKCFLSARPWARTCIAGAGRQLRLVRPDLARARGAGHFLRQYHRRLSRVASLTHSPYRDQRLVAFEERICRRSWTAPGACPRPKPCRNSTRPRSSFPKSGSSSPRRSQATAPPMTQSLAYRDMHIEDIKGGKAARVTIAGMSSEIKGPRSLNTSIGKLLVTDYDFAGVVRFDLRGGSAGRSAQANLGSKHFG